MAIFPTSEKEVISILQKDGKGWDVTLFRDENEILNDLCVHCHGVCCDMVGFSCVNKDNIVFNTSKYCNDCIHSFSNCNQKCPINSKLHSAHIIRPNFPNRSKILSYLVNCPYSSEFQKEGIFNCHWKGTLHNLISFHFIKCYTEHNPHFDKVINLKNKIKNLNQKICSKDLIISEQKQNLNKLSAINSDMKNKIKNTYTDKENEIYNLYRQFKLNKNNEINELKNEIIELKSKLQQQNNIKNKKKKRKKAKAPKAYAGSSNQLKWREKQIQIAKNTVKYRTLIETYPQYELNQKDKFEIDGKIFIGIPNTNENIGKKRWIGKYNKWRRFIHELIK